MSVEQLMDDIYSSFGDRDLREGEFTVGLYAERHGLTYQKASDQIARALEAGVIVEVKRSAVYNDRRVNHVYKKAD